MRRLLVMLGALLVLPCLAADEAALVERGRALYHGHAAFARGTAATTLRLPADMAACARCHGAAGDGGREGGQPVPALRWSALMQPRDARPPFADDAALLRAIVHGQRPDGTALAPAMPRYALQPHEAQALLAYLRRLGTDADQPPGVSAEWIRLGSVVPLSGPAAGVGSAIAAGLRAGFDEANRRGGVHGRRIELQLQDSRAGVRQALAAWQTQPVYALTGGLWNEAQEHADALLAQAHLAHLATLVVREQAPRAADWSADLLAPLAQQRSALAQALAGCASGARLAVAPGDAASAAATDGVRWLSPQAPLPDELRQAQAGCIGYTLANAPAVHAALPPGWTQTLVLPMPAAVLDPASGGERAAAPWYRLGLVAAHLTTELLSRAGRQLHERSLLDQLDRVSELEGAPGLVVHYDRQRRHAWSPLLVPLGGSTGAAAAAPVSGRGG